MKIRILLLFLLIGIISCNKKEEKVARNTNNFIISIVIDTPSFSVHQNIDQNTTAIMQTVPQNLDLENLNIKIIYSEKAVIAPNPDIINNYSIPVKYTVTAESGEKRIYYLTIKQ